MSFQKKLWLLSISIIACSACKNKLDVLAPYKDITVVYGLLDQSDTAHYIRINKGFEGPGNAYSMAMQYDSIYYPVNVIKAVLEDSNPNTNSIVKIDSLDTITTIPLDPGLFSYPKQLLYYTKAALNLNDYYNLVITNIKTGKKIIGSTTLIPSIQLSGIGNKILDLSFYGQYPTNISWNTLPNVRIYQLTIRFYYDEITSNNTRTMKSVDWVLPTLSSQGLSGGEELEYSLFGQSLCRFILNAIPYEQGVTRYVDSAGVIFTSGSDDLNTYILLNQPRLEINQDIPTYSDLKNGIGLFTSRHTQISYKGVGEDIIDTLAKEPIYSSLNFQLQ